MPESSANSAMRCTSSSGTSSQTKVPTPDGHVRSRLGVVQRVGRLVVHEAVPARPRHARRVERLHLGGRAAGQVEHGRLEPAVLAGDREPGEEFVAVDLVRRRSDVDVGPGEVGDRIDRRLVGGSAGQSR